jgi:hypothetical protein
MNTGFLDSEQLATLTGRRTKSRQIAVLRDRGIPFRINATGHPVVSWTAVDGGKLETQQKDWVPRVLRN